MNGAIYTPRAREDLAEIWDYTARQWTVEQADTYITEIVAVCDALARGERFGRQADEVRQGYQRLGVASHVIYYRQTGTLIEVVRVLHQRMNATRHLLD